jgi:enoyl-CoA hydratase
MTVLLIDDPAPGVRRLTLNRPESRNALSRELVERLEAAFAQVDGDAAVRAVVLRASGSSFCAGADFDEHFRASGYDIGRTDLWERIESCRVPVVAAVQGWAVTGGFLLAYCCDVVVAADSARFRDTHALLGLVPTGGESQRMPRRLGPFIARDLMLTSRVMGAEEAHRIGFVSRVVPGEQLDKAALEVATAIADNAARSVEAIKQLINVGSQADLGVGLRLEALRNQFGQANNTDDPERRARVDRIRSPR